MNKILLLCFMLLLVPFSPAQETFPVNGVQDERANAIALTDVTLNVDYQTVIEGATLLIRDGVISAAGKDLKIPADAIVYNLKGKHIYPSFIDPYTTYGITKDKRRGGGSPWSSREVISPETDGAYNANDAIKSQFNASEAFKADDKKAKAWREAGFGALLTHRDDGIARGTGAVVTTGDDTANEIMLAGRAAAHFSYQKGTSRQSYPVSAMGSVALLRQTHLDAAWYGSQNPRPFQDESLEALLASKDLPQIFEARNWHEVLRTQAVAKEFGIDYIVKGGGDSYQRLDQIKAAGMRLIVPLDYPEAYDVSDPLESANITLNELKHWEMAPANAAHLEKAGVQFAFTTHGLKKKGSFKANIAKAIENGLSEKAALKAATHAGAAMLGLEGRLGALKQGYIANFLITDGPIFKNDTAIYENWVQGKRHVFKQDLPEIAGEYELTIGDASFPLSLSGKGSKVKASIKAAEEATEGDETSESKKEKKGTKVAFKFTGELVTMNFAPSKDAKPFRLSGWFDGKNFQGVGFDGAGNNVTWNATYKGEAEKKDKKDKDKKGKKGKKNKDADEDPLGEITYPFTSFGLKELPKQETILIKGATVWTNEEDGILKDTDVLVADGKIKKIGKNLKKRGARVIDGKGLHLTPGIIDEHSHIAMSSTNDVATNSGMVRMGDVLNSQDINIYRQLSGGVTASQLLHGSANPIGGQSAIIKLRWGSAPEDLLIKDAAPFIKFALGENVKRSSNNNSIRFPNSRMGVEQVYRDAFNKALEYEKALAAYNALSDADKAKAVAPRRDLATEAMLEIIRKQRFITCHSYVQSEINMLMKVAEDYDFRINTFTHILEGYKVADKMKEHGVGGSTFSDWWAYKWEVRYAIPYNPTLMHNEGVVVAINSDDREMARRLNQEAAKSIKYGGMSEEDALKMVTLNPAKLLHLDDRMGSIKIGKDADLVLWTDNPLSIYARVDHTLIDGAVYYNEEIANDLLAYNKAERARLTAKSRDAGGKGKSKAAKWGRHNVDLHCDTILGEHIHGGH